MALRPNDVTLRLTPPLAAAARRNRRAAAGGVRVYAVASGAVSTK
jgi:hypothetical protein